MSIQKSKRRSCPDRQAVEQLTLDNKHVAYYSSAKEAAASFGKTRDSNIGNCCRGLRNTCFGFKWRFVND